jgi:hypothetical protein
VTTIVPQRPPLAALVRPSLLQSLALQLGQVLEATVIGTVGAGATKVDIGGHVLSLALPQPAPAGEKIQLQVQSTGPQIKLVLQQPETKIQGGNGSVVSAGSPPLEGQTAGTVPNGGGVSGVTPRAPVPVAGNSSGQVAVPNQTPLPSTAVPSAPRGGPAALPNEGATRPSAGAVNPTKIVTQTPAASSTPSAISAADAGNPEPLQPTTPAALKAAVSQMVHAAVPRQVPVVALTAALTAVLGKVALPEPVVRAAQQVLGGQVALDSQDFDGAALQAAVRGSGLFLEAGLARGQTPSPQTDMKLALLALQQALTKWLGPQAPMPAAGQAPPPVKGVPPRMRDPSVPPLDLDAPAPEVGKQLLERTEAALARTRLHQSASLPEPAVKAADWSLDLPVLIGQHQTMLQFQIHADEQGQGSTPAERGWQMRFALNLPALGEVGAQVSFRSGSTGVMLWASDPAAARALEEHADTLREAMAAAGLRLGALVVRAGAPVTAAPQTRGQLVDSRS